jgi:hypothetical protein
MFYVNYVYTFVFKKVWDQFNESISSHPSMLTFAVFNCNVLVTKDGLKYCL